MALHMHSNPFRTDPTNQIVPSVVCMSHYTRAHQLVQKASSHKSHRHANRNVRKCMCSSVLLWKCQLLARSLGLTNLEQPPRRSRTPPADRLFMIALVLCARPSTIVPEIPDACAADHTSTSRNHNNIPPLVGVLLAAAKRLVETCTTVSCHRKRPIPAHPAHAQTIFSEFRRAFVSWLHQDKTDMVNMLVVSYNNLQSTKDHSDCTKEVAEHVERTQQTILQRAVSLGVSASSFLAQAQAQVQAHATNTDAVPEPGTEATSGTCGGSTEDMQPDLSTRSKIETVDDVVRRAFWDDFARRLNENETSQLHALLTELVDAIADLTPNREDLHNELHREVDVGLIVQMVQHQCLEDADFQRTTEAIVRRVAGLIAPARSAPLLEWYSSWSNQTHTTTNTDAPPVMVTMLPAYLERLHTEIGLARRACGLIREGR